MYNETAKKASMKYNSEKREDLKLNLPKGKKEEYKRYAESKGKSLTKLITELIEKDMQGLCTP